MLILIPQIQTEITVSVQVHAWRSWEIQNRPSNQNKHIPNPWFIHTWQEQDLCALAIAPFPEYMHPTELSHCYPQTARAAPSSSLFINTMRTSLWARYIQFRLCHPVYRTNREQQPGFLICSQNTREEYMCIISCQHYTPNASRCTIRTRLHCLRASNTVWSHASVGRGRRRY